MTKKYITSTSYMYASSEVILAFTTEITSYLNGSSRGWYVAVEEYLDDDMAGFNLLLEFLLENNFLLLFWHKALGKRRCWETRHQFTVNTKARLWGDIISFQCINGWKLQHCDLDLAMTLYNCMFLLNLSHNIVKLRYVIRSGIRLWQICYYYYTDKHNVFLRRSVMLLS